MNGERNERSTEMKETHCELCGQPVDPFRTDGGYTNCCNEPICYGGGECVTLRFEYDTIHFHNREDADYFLAEQKEEQR